MPYNPNSNQCGYCKERFVVDSLARICEQKHEGVVFKSAAEKLREEKKARASTKIYSGRYGKGASASRPGCERETRSTEERGNKVTNSEHAETSQRQADMDSA